MAPETLIESHPRPDSLPPPPGRFHRPWTVIIGLIFLLAPALAFVAGDRARPIENRPLASAPSLSDGWDFFPNAATWFTDHLPLRRQAIRTNRSITQRAFGEEPSYGGTAGLPAGVARNDAGTPAKPAYPKVIVGKDGWLYLGEDFERPCEPERSLDEIFRRLARLERLVTGSGRRFVFTVAPDKASMVPEKLPATVVGEECAATRKRAFWQRMATDAPAGYFDLRAPLKRQQEADGEPIYRQIDTHWALHGAAVYAEELAAALDPTVWEGTRVTRVRTARDGGDLARLLGDVNRNEQTTVWNVERPGVEGNFDEVENSDDPVHVMNTTTGVALFEPRTALLGDSFTNASRAVYSLFADLVRVSNEGTDGQLVAQAVADAEVVVYQVVERYIVSGDTSILSNEGLGLIEAALATAR